MRTFKNEDSKPADVCMKMRTKHLDRLHCKQELIYVFPEMKLRGLVHNFHIHVSVDDLYIPKIGPPSLLQQNRQIECGNL
jgi:hypothetical protein